MRKEIVVVQYFIFCLFLGACIPSKRTLPAELKEVSGITKISTGQTFWINDGGNDPVIYWQNTLIPTQKWNSFEVKDQNIDWEALSHQGDSILCICDIGDNRKERKSVSAIFINLNTKEHRRQELYYPDKPHNAEACDIIGDSLFILTKADASDAIAKHRTAYLYMHQISTNEPTLERLDSVRLKNRSITDMVFTSNSQLAFVAYDARFIWGIPFTKTTVYSLGLDGSMSFIKQSLKEKPIRAPFTWTQYESITPSNDDFVIASEKTLLFAPRWRYVKMRLK